MHLLREDTPREKLIKYRLMNGLTQREMAKRLGVGFSTLCKYEEGLIAISNRCIKYLILFLYYHKVLNLIMTINFICTKKHM